MYHYQNIRIAIPLSQLKYFNEKTSVAQQLFSSLSLLSFVHLIFQREMKNIKDITLMIFIQDKQY